MSVYNNIILIITIKILYVHTKNGVSLITSDFHRPRVIEDPARKGPVKLNIIHIYTCIATYYWSRSSHFHLVWCLAIILHHCMYVRTCVRMYYPV